MQIIRAVIQGSAAGLAVIAMIIIGNNLWSAPVQHSKAPLSVYDCVTIQDIDELGVHRGMACRVYEPLTGAHFVMVSKQSNYGDAVAIVRAD